MGKDNGNGNGKDWIDFLKDANANKTLRDNFVSEMTDTILNLPKEQQANALVEWLKDTKKHSEEYHIEPSDAQKIVDGSKDGDFKVNFSY